MQSSRREAHERVQRRACAGSAVVRQLAKDLKERGQYRRSKSNSQSTHDRYAQEIASKLEDYDISEVASLLAAAAALNTQSRGALLAAGPPPFRLTLPPDFVKLGSTNGQDVLLMAGDFRGMIANTGAATTISVQRLSFSLPEGSSMAEAAAEQLASLRDSQTGLPAGCQWRR